MIRLSRGGMDTRFHYDGASYISRETVRSKPSFPAATISFLRVRTRISSYYVPNYYNSS